MQDDIDEEVIYYYDCHSTEDDLLGQTVPHSSLASYLMEVLRWLLHEHRHTVHGNLAFYQTMDEREYPLDPDIAVIKGVPFQDVSSWRVGRSGPAPQIIFEIVMDETWRRDLYELPALYAQMGVQEYFVYDPHDPPVIQGTSQRLFGWERDDETGTLVPLQPDPDGSLWSTELDSWLVPDGWDLRLYSAGPGQVRLTEAEAMTQRAEAEAKARQAAERRAQAEAEARRAAERKVQALLEKLRSLGYDPD